MLFTSLYKACLTKKTYSKMVEERNIGEKSATTWMKLFLCSRAVVVQAQLDIKEVKIILKNWPKLAILPVSADNRVQKRSF